MITKELIKSLNPCKDRYDNYLKYYGDKALTIAQFMDSKNLTQADKLWVVFRLMPRDAVRVAAADIAESVLHIFEDAYPNDDRPRKAIAAARAGDVDKAREAVSAAATSAFIANADGSYTSDAAAYAATSAANVANTYASAYADYASTSASYAGKAVRDLDKEEKLIREIVLKYWKE